MTRRSTRLQEFGHRAVDLSVAVVGLVVLIPVLLACALLVRLTSPGPALFVQTRVGRGARLFPMYKFRTMRNGCADTVHRAYVQQLLTSDRPQVGGSGGLYKLESDRRVTSFGHFLRRTSLDELPQLFNVLRGEMSIVGPRPALPYETEFYEPRHRARFDVRPGITGLWQVSGRGRLTMREALDLDVAYVHQRRVSLDLRIIARTVPALLSRRTTS